MKIEVWCEGYAATGESATARLLIEGEFDTFDAAVEAWFATLTDDYSRKCVVHHTDGHWSFWACRMFDNEADARRSFG